MPTHIVKSWPKLFQAVVDGKKTFDYRNNDRGYQKGDTVIQREYNPYTGTFTGREITVAIDEVYDSTEIPGLPAQFVLMGIHPISGVGPGSIVRKAIECE